MLDSNSSSQSLEIVGLNAQGKLVDILWSNSKAGSKSLHERMFAKEPKREGLGIRARLLRLIGSE